MNRQVFNKTLQATARIACCASLVSIAGCGDKPTDTGKDTGPTDSGESEITIPEEPAFDTCMDAIDAGFSTPEFDTSQLLDCCLLATEEVGYDALYNDPQYADLQENCCAEIANQNEFSPACTPWGPPTPPAMPPKSYSRTSA